MQRQLEVAYLLLVCALCVFHEHLRGDVGGSGLQEDFPASVQLVP